MPENETASEVPETSATSNADLPKMDAVPAESSTAPDDARQEPPSEEKKPHWATKRIDELTRNWREAERRNEQLMAALHQQKTPAPEPVPEVLPTLESVGYDEQKYQAALLQHAARHAERAADARIEQRERERAERNRMDAFDRRQAEFAKQTADYEDRVLSDHTLPISAAMRDVIVDSEDGPAIAYYLAEHRDVADRIARLPAHLAARELGRIEERLQATREAKAKPPAVTQAPPPAPTIEASEPAVERDPDSMSINEWVKWRNKQVRKRPEWAR